MNKGVYGGQQIVSAKWIREMTEPRTVEGKHFRGMDYGYLWWILFSGRLSLGYSVLHKVAVFHKTEVCV